MNDDYRARLYGGYVSTHLDPESLEVRLQRRRRFMESLIRKHFPPDRTAKIVEFGCGHGTLLYYARRLGYTEVCGFDVSSEQVDAAARMGVTGVRQSDLLDAIRGQSDATVHAVVTIDVIEHLTVPEALEFADNAFRVLRPGGRWISHQPNACSPFFGAVRYGDLTHELAYTCESFRQLAHTCGFAKISCYEDVPPVSGFTSAVRRLGWTAVSAVLRVVNLVETGYTSRVLSRNFLAVATK